MAQEQLQIECDMTNTEQVGEQVLCVKLTDELPVMGFQMELFLPEGLTLKADNPVEINSSLAGHTLRLHNYENGHYLILVYDLGLKAATIRKEELLKCHFLVSPKMLPGNYLLAVSGIKLAKDAQTAVCPGPYEGYFILDESGATAIRSIGQSNSAPIIYDLSGRRHDEPQEGVNIIDRRKVLFRHRGK